MLYNGGERSTFTSHIHAEKATLYYTNSGAYRLIQMNNNFY